MRDILECAGLAIVATLGVMTFVVGYIVVAIVALAITVGPIAALVYCVYLVCKSFGH